MPDRVVVHPIGPDGLRGTVRVPGDKSISHRAFLLGALAGGPVTVRGAARSADVLATVAAVRALGARVDEDGETARVQGPLHEPDDVLDCGNAGTALRLLAGVCAGLDGMSVLTGDASLRRRPMGRVAEPLRRMGAVVDGRGGGTLAPLVVRGGALQAIDYRPPAPSAQVKSCVLLAGLGAAGTTRVREVAPTRDHTERMLAWMGADSGVDAEGAWVRPGMLTPRDLDVPADPSSAAFWLCAAAALPGSRVDVAQLCLNPTRTGVLDVLAAMGASCSTSVERTQCGEPVGDVSLGYAGTLRPAEVAGDRTVAAIDELPVLAVAGALGGGLEVRDAAELRVKESDRIAGVTRVLAAVGGRVEERGDGFAVAPGLRPPDATGHLDAGGDHRVAMAGAVAALGAAEPVTITGFAAVATSYPTFLGDLERLGGRWEAA